MVIRGSCKTGFFIYAAGIALTAGLAGMKKRDAITAVIWILLGLTISIWSATFPFGNLRAPGPAFLPLILGLILILLGSVLFLQTVKPRRGKTGETLPSPLIPDRGALTRVVLTLVGMFLSAALLEVLGFILTVFCLILFLMRAIEPQRWRVAIFYASVSALSSFIIFQVIFKTSLPRGFLGL